VVEVNKTIKFRSCPILEIPSSPTNSARKRCIKREITNRMLMTTAFKEVIFNNKFSFKTLGIFKLK
jgi:hypothetical protein